MKKIVVGIDGSEASSAALDWACDEARLWGAGLTVVHAWHYPYRRPGSAAVEQMRGDAQAVLDAAAGRAGERAGDMAVEPVLAEGDTAESILDAGSDADLIVVGSRGRGGFKTLLLGSISHTVVQHSQCPVAVIRAHS